MTKSEIKYILKWAKKFKAITMLGGKCYGCKENNPYVLDFHHKNPNEKEFQISLVGLHKKWSTIEKEIQKCILLCRNCHITQHCSQINKRRMKIKQQMLEYKGTFKCSCCSHEDLTGISLEFHHFKHKKDNISDIISKSTGTYTKQDFVLTDYLLNELDKCDVICRNCHVTKHVNMTKQRELKNQINAKILTMKENQKIDAGQIEKMLFFKKQGLSAQKISEKLRCNLGSVEYYVYIKDKMPIGHHN